MLTYAAEFWSAYAQEAATRRPRMELVLRYMRLQAIEAGIDFGQQVLSRLVALLVQIYQYKCTHTDTSSTGRCLVDLLLY